MQAVLPNTVHQKLTR